MAKYQKIAFLFPGQGAQYPGMGKDFYEKYPIVKQTFQQADEILGYNLSKIILEGPQNTLTETKNSQPAIYIVSIAIWNVLKELFPPLKPFVCAGLSLGEYTALTVSEKISFGDNLPLVQKRGQAMNDACEATKGTMAVVIGLDANTVEKLVKEVNLPNDLWAANFNCPGQVVLSGTVKGIEAGTKAATAKGASMVVPLQVHGAFHSGLMQQAEEKMVDPIKKVSLKDSGISIVMNVPGDFVLNEADIRQNMINQITRPVRWEQGIRKMSDAGRFIP